MAGKSIYLRLIVFMVCLAIVPVAVVGSVSSDKTAQDIRERTGEVEQGFLREYQQKTDLLLNEVTKIALAGALEYSSKYPNYNSLSSRQLLEMVSYNNKVINVHELVDSIYVYYIDGGRLIGASQDDTEWLRLYNDVNGDGKSAMTWINERMLKTPQNSVGKSVITIIVAFPFGKIEKTGYFVLNIDKEKLFSTAGYSSGSDKVAVLDENGQLIKTSQYSDILGENIPVYDEVTHQGDDTAALPWRNGDERLLLVSVTSPYNHWRYVSILNEQVIMAPVYNLQRFILLLVILVIAIGIVFAMLAARNIYNPVKGLVDYFIEKTIESGQTETINKKGKNELMLLKAMYDIIHQKKAMAELSLQNNSPAIKEYLCKQLLEGQSLNDSSLNEQYRELGFDERGFIAMLAIPDEIDDMNVIGDNTDATVNMEIVKDSIEQGLGKLFNIASAINNHGVAVIINHDSLLEEGATTHLRDIIESLIKSVKQQCGISFSAGMGTIVENVYEIPLSYGKALKASQYRLYFAKESVLFYEELDQYMLQNENKGFCFPVDEERALMDYIKLRNKEQAFELIHEVGRRLKTGMADPVYAKGLFSYLRGSLFNMAAIMGENLSDIFGDQYYKLYKKLDSLETIDGFESYICNIADVIVDYMENKQNKKNSEMIAAVKTYLTEHLGEDICLDAAAEIAGVSTSYLSTLFKRETGENFSDYLISLKMVKAMELLKTTDLSVGEVASRVGYTNNHSFSTLFKKYTGMTPTTYRTAALTTSVKLLNDEIERPIKK